MSKKSAGYSLVITVNEMRLGEMTEWLVAKHNDLSSNPETIQLQARTYSCKLFSDLYIPRVA